MKQPALTITLPSGLKATEPLRFLEAIYPNRVRSGPRLMRIRNGTAAEERPA